MRPSAAALITLLLLIVVRPGVADELSLATVLQTSLEHFPRIQSAIEETLIRSGRNTAALGAFDLALEQDGLLWADGFYDGSALDSRLAKRLPSSNAKVYAGYRVSNDDFPIYQQELVTNDLGEFNLGVVFSLWRDRSIDAQRFAVSKSELEIQAAEIDLMLARLTTQRNAAKAYWSWVLAGHRARVFEELLALAEKRVSGLEQRQLAGDVASIYLVENEQNLLRRRALVTDARRQLDVAAVALSLYVRTADGVPRIAHHTELPADFPQQEEQALEPESLIERVLAQRPELLQLDNLAAIEQKRLLLARNELKPRIDLGLKAAHDMGGGSRTRDGFDAIVDVQVSVPLEWRRGTGQVNESRARLRQIALDRRLLGERLANEVRKLTININAAREMFITTNNELTQARRMVDAERQRFSAGASDFFLVNLREERSADANVRNLESRARYFNSLTDLQAITLDLVALGI